MRLYDDLDTFFRAREIPQRPDGSWWEDSYDYGVWWLDDERRTHRLTWIGPRGRHHPDTAGELYLVRLDGPVVGSLAADVALVAAGADTGRVKFLCRIPPTLCDECASDGQVALSCRHVPGPDSAVEALLDGWAEVCGNLNSVAWIRDRAWEAERLWGEV